jgi:hypothetical protein
MKNSKKALAIIFLALAFTKSKHSFAQTVTVFSSDEGSKKTLIESVYTYKNRLKFVKTIKGETNNFVCEKVIINDTVYFKLKNYYYLINQKYFDVKKYKNVTISFRIVNKNQILLRKVDANGVIEYYMYEKSGVIRKFILQ